MAKSQNKGNRELRKPKADKKAPKTQASPFAERAGMVAPKPGGKKK